MSREYRRAAANVHGQYGDHSHGDNGGVIPRKQDVPKDQHHAEYRGRKQPGEHHIARGIDVGDATGDEQNQHRKPSMLRPPMTEPICQADDQQGEDG